MRSKFGCTPKIRPTTSCLRAARSACSLRRRGPVFATTSQSRRGRRVSGSYDPMLGKLIVYDSSRADCIARLRAALDDYVVGGIATNLPLLRRIVAEQAFLDGDTTTDFLELHGAAASSETKSARSQGLAAAAGALQSLGAWRHVAEQREVCFVEADVPVRVRWDYERGAWLCAAGKI